MLLGLFVLATKLTNKQYLNMSSKKYVKILEKTLISKDTYSLVIKIGDVIYVGISSPYGFEVIKELNKMETVSVEANYFNSVNTVSNNSQPVFNPYQFNVQNQMNSNFRRVEPGLNKVQNDFISVKDFFIQNLSKIKFDWFKKSENENGEISLLNRIQDKLTELLISIFEKINKVIKEK
jgi:flagellar protein FliO/FliZ